MTLSHTRITAYTLNTCPYLFMHSRTYTKTHMHTMYSHTHIHSNTHIHTHTCTHTHTCPHTHTYAHTHTHAHTQIHTHTHTQVHIHTHTHAHVIILRRRTRSSMHICTLRHQHSHIYIHLHMSDICHVSNELFKQLSNDSILTSISYLTTRFVQIEKNSNLFSFSLLGNQWVFMIIWAV